LTTYLFMKGNIITIHEKSLFTPLQPDTHPLSFRLIFLRTTCSYRKHFQRLVNQMQGVSGTRKHDPKFLRFARNTYIS
ncbi:hypothetical protein T01_7718, partial [Trichinella spiralis]